MLFLQHNKIELIQNLETLISLEYLSLSYNSIRVLEGLQFNKKLAYLDVSRNQIASVKLNQLPD